MTSLRSVKAAPNGALRRLYDECNTFGLITRQPWRGARTSAARDAMPLSVFATRSPKVSSTKKIVGVIGVVSLLYVGANLEFAPFSGRLRLVAIPVRK